MTTFLSLLRTGILAYWNPLLGVFAFVLGALVGSFLNVVVVRLPHEKSIVWPGSHCPSCKAAIRWWDNIPLLSYLVLRGKCRSCKKPISARYPAIELITAILFLAAQLRFGFSFELIARDLPFLSILIAVTFIDLEHRIIPDQLSLGGLVLGVVSSVFFTYYLYGQQLGGTSVTWPYALLGAGVGFGSFYGLAWLYLRLTGRSGLGGGDIKLLAMMGSFIGIQGVFATVLISSVFGSIVGIAWAFFQNRASKTTADSVMLTSIPYGPFLVVGGLYYYFLGNVLWFRFLTPM